MDTLAAASVKGLQEHIDPKRTQIRRRQDLGKERQHEEAKKLGKEAANQTRGTTTQAQGTPRRSMDCHSIRKSGCNPKHIRLTDKACRGVLVHNILEVLAQFLAENPNGLCLRIHRIQTPSR